MSEVLQGDEALVLGEIRALCRDLHRGAPPALGLDSRLAASVGLDSLAMVELVDRLAGASGVTLGEEAFRAATPRDLVALLRSGDRRRGGTKRAFEQALISARAEPADDGAWPEGARTLAEALRWHAERHPEKVTIRLVGAERAGAQDVTYGELTQRAERVARQLVADGLGPGERVAIMLGTGHEYFAVFMGVLLAGAVPVPIYPPLHMAELQEHLERQARLLVNAGASMLVTVPQAMTVERLVSARVPSMRAVVVAGDLVGSDAGAAPLPRVGAHDLALIQYTSGSTGDPKGVVLDHAQLLANTAAMANAARLSERDVVVSWLPLYHDMGLIGVWHTTLVVGVPFVVMTPLTFLARPVRWLEAISDYGGTISAAANFAYQMCAERIAEDATSGLDLSTWRIAFNGSEPVTTGAVDAFCRRFASAGFRPEAMCPAYGLAEAGVGVTFSPLGRGPRVDTVSRTELARGGRAVPVTAGVADGQEIVGCGYPLAGYGLTIVGPRGGALEARREGRVLVRGPSMTRGYFSNPSATRRLWDGDWLETGDLGYLADGELFLTGRTKDLIIRGGRNLHPQELEAAISEITGVAAGGACVFASADAALATERLVAVVEREERAKGREAAIEEGVRQASASLLGAPVDEVVFVAPGSLRRTPTNKIRRAATRDAFESGALGRKAPPLPVQLARLGLGSAGGALRRAAGLLGAYAFGAWAWALVAVVGGAVAAAVHLPVPMWARWRVVRRGVRMIAGSLRIRVDVQGALPEMTRPAIVVANHPSFVDAALLVLASPSPLSFTTSTDFARKPVIGPFLARIGCVFVSRGDASRAAGQMDELARAVRSGSRLAVFPEGSITRAVGVRPFHLGAFRVAGTVGCDIVPVAISGTRRIVRAGSYLPRRADARVIVGDPVTAPGGGFAAQAETAAQVRIEVASLADEPVLGH